MVFRGSGEIDDIPQEDRSSHRYHHHDEFDFSRIAPRDKHLTIIILLPILDQYTYSVQNNEQNLGEIPVFFD